MKPVQWLLFGALILNGCTQQPGGSATNATASNVTTTQETSATSTPDAPATSATPSGDETDTATPGTATPGATSQTKLEPLPGADAPALKKVVKARFKTTAGDIHMEIYPEAAPNAAKRFEELIKAGFYDNTPISRVVPGFVVQFGVNSRPKMKEWKEKNFDDDPSHFKLSEGTLAFAKAGPNTNSTQVFINYGDNSNLVANGNFTAFGKVTKGMEVATGFKQVGDPSGGLDQGALWEDTEGYLKTLPEQPDMIVKAEIIK
jgi:peptidyl-prolyl cis-trans isomerase A (cyclophilin A)